MLSAEDNAKVTQTGPGTAAGVVLRQYWQPAALVEELDGPRPAKAVRLLGEDLVLFRDEEGTAHVLDAHCRHLGAHIGYGGTVEGDGIRCPFHAWKWNGEGICTDIPYAKRIPAGARIRTWPSVEKNGLVMVHHHTEGAGATYEVPDLPQIGADGWTPLEIRHWKVRSRWLDMNENAVDQIHFHYVHGTVTTPETQVEQDGHILRCRSR